MPTGQRSAIAATVAPDDSGVHPVSSSVLLESHAGDVTCAGILLTWGGGRGARVALCTVVPEPIDVMQCRLALPPLGSKEWRTIQLADVAASQAVRTTSSVTVLHLNPRILRRHGWPFRQLARSRTLSVTALAPGARAFWPALCDRQNRRLMPPIVLEARLSGRHSELLLSSTHPQRIPPGTPLFVLRPKSRVALQLAGFVLAAVDATPGTYKVAHVSALLSESSNWKRVSAPNDASGARSPLRGVHPLIASFLAASIATGKVSRATISARRQDLATLDRWARSEGLDLARLTEEQLRQYFRFREDEGISPLTLVRSRSSVDRFYAHCVSIGDRRDVPVAQLERQDALYRPKVFLNEVQVRSLIEQPDDATPLGRRDRAILEVLYATAIKPSELVSLKISDVDLAGGTLHVRGRRYGAKRLPINATALAALRGHLRELNRRGVTSRGDTVFWTSQGLPLTYNRVGDIVRRHALAAGLAKDVTGSTLRNSVANHLRTGGMDRKSLAAFLGVRDDPALDAYSSPSPGIHEVATNSPAMKQDPVSPTR
jgi:site-specific recombinase XerD